MTRKFSIILVTILAIVAIFSTVGCHNKRGRSVHTHKDTATIYIEEAAFHPIVNVYLENSGSMDGYMSGETEFKQIVYNFLTDLKIECITESLNLFYINSNILRQKDDIDDFIRKLNPTTFRKKGGDRGASDIAQMIDNIMGQMNDTVVSIFISDCIFSPGKGKDAQQYLSNQEIGIKRTVGEYFNSHPRFAVVGYQCYSSFNGLYYDKDDAGTTYNGSRPFYIWMMGTQNALRRITFKIPPSRFHGEGVKNTFVCFAGEQQLPDSCYAIKQGSGKFKPSKKDSRHGISDLKKGRNGQVTFAINAHLSPLLLSDDYLLDPEHYIVSEDNYKVTKIDPILANSKYSYTLHFVGHRVLPTNLTIRLMADIPSWVNQLNDEDGMRLDATNQDKTFGLKHLVNGFNGGILRGQTYYTRMSITINE